MATSWQGYPTLELKAAALLHSLVRSHPMADGNKRLAWLATVVFLDLNGVTVMLGDDDAFDVVLKASGAVRDRPDRGAGSADGEAEIGPSQSLLRGQSQ